MLDDGSSFEATGRRVAVETGCRPIWQQVEHA
jgi:hypothetical protein